MLPPRLTRIKQHLEKRRKDAKEPLRRGERELLDELSCLDSDSNIQRAISVRSDLISDIPITTGPVGMCPCCGGLGYGLGYE